MDLQMVGRHALLFDDDAMAAFVNSGDALVEWHSLQIDRYDVRHLLSAPPPSRRRNSNRASEVVLLKDLSLESQLDHERYLDLPSHDDQPDAEEDKHQTNATGYGAVGFSYGSTDDSSYQKNTDTGAEASGFIPHFPVPDNLRHSLPTSEKLHQIIARTAMFVSKHSGQSEIILRLKQEENPMFGFLMPGHQLHAYFRYLVEHPEFLTPASDASPQDDGKETGNNHNISSEIGGALSLLGSVYGSGEEEDDHDIGITEKDISQDQSSSAIHIHSSVSKNIQPQIDVVKDESVSRNQILSNKEGVLTAKKSPLMIAAKSRSVKGVLGESCLVSADADKAKRSAIGMTSKNDPVILEPPPAIKRLMDKLIDFIMVNGKSFEATLEQDCMQESMPFLVPSDKYHSYYLKALERARKSKRNGKGLYWGMDDPSRRRLDKQAYVLKGKISASCDLPLESDKKEKFKMVIGRSKKETPDAESKGAHQDYGISVDAAAAAAILQAATKGIKQSILQPNSSIPSDHIHASSGEDGHPGNLGNLLPSRGENTVAKLDHTESPNGSDVRTVAVEVVNHTHSSETHLTKEQKLKAERLKKAKMFVAMLKNGAVPGKTETSRGPSLEPLEPGVVRSTSEVDIDCPERGRRSITPMDIDGRATGDKLERNYFGEEHNWRLLKRKYRSRSGHKDDGEDDGDLLEHNKPRSKRDRRSRSKEQGRDLTNTSEDEGESSEGDRGHKRHRSKHRSHHSTQDDVHDDRHKKDKNEKQSRKKYHSDSSPRRHSRKHRSSKRHLQEDGHDYDDGERGHSQRKHHSHHSSHHGRDKCGRVNERPFGDKESRSNHKHGSSSGDRCQNHGGMDKHGKELYNKRNELEEGEISSRISEELRGISAGHGREASVDASSYQRSPSQPSETTTEVPDDFRAKIRAMLMATHL